MTTLSLDSTFPLNDGTSIPRLGFGLYQLEDAETCATCVHTALEAGVRHFDTATMYNNEEFLGEALSGARAPREDLFITTKCWIDDFGAAATRKALETSLRKLRTDYVDLYLLHWPKDETMMEAWEAMLEMRREGKLRSAGVSNFTVKRFEEFFFHHTDVVPAVNQIEQHPRRWQPDVEAYCEAKGIGVESYSPLGRSEVLDEEPVVRIARDLERTPAQVVLRWHLQHGRIVIPKSAHPERIRENADLFGFELDDEQMRRLDNLDADDTVIPWRPDGWY